MKDRSSEPQGQLPVRPSQARRAALGVAIAVQLLAVAVMAFGDIGFNRPGRFGLNLDHWILLALLWLLSLGAGFAIAWGVWRLLVLQFLVLCLVVGGGLLSVYMQLPNGPTPPADSRMSPK